MSNISYIRQLFPLCSYEIMLDCWQDNPASRPTFTQLKATFDVLLLEGSPYIQFEGTDTHEPYYDDSPNISSSISMSSSKDGIAVDNINLQNGSRESSSGAGSFHESSPLSMLQAPEESLSLTEVDTMH